MARMHEQKMMLTPFFFVIFLELNPDLAGNKLHYSGNYGTMQADGTPQHQPMQLGHSYENGSQGVKFEQHYTVDKDTKQRLEFVLSRNAWLFGATCDRKLLEAAGYKGNFAARWTAPDGEVRTGFQGAIVEKDSKPTLKTLDWYFTARTQWGATAAAFNYDHVNMKGSSLVGAQINNGDHTWKFRLNSTGMARAALQWNLHPSTKATLNTKVNMTDFV